MQVRRSPPHRPTSWAIRILRPSRSRLYALTLLAVPVLLWNQWQVLANILENQAILNDSNDNHHRSLVDSSSSSSSSSSWVTSDSSADSSSNEPSRLQDYFHFSPEEEKQLENDVNSSPWESRVIKCVGTSGVNATCLYANLYVNVLEQTMEAYTIQGSTHDQWFQHNQTVLQLHGVKYDRITPRELYTVSVRQFSSAKALQDYCEHQQGGRGILSINQGIHLVFKLYFANIGHALFDDLWGSFLGLAELGFMLDDPQTAAAAPFHVVPFRTGNTRYERLPFDDLLQPAFQAIGQGAYLSNETIPHNTGAVKLAWAVAGSGHRGQRTMNANYELCGARWLLRTYRDRLYQGLGVRIPQQRRCLEQPPSPQHPTRIKILENKRYTPSELEAMNKVMEFYRQNTQENVTFEFVDWKDYPTFKDQVQMVSETDIYISGPGTGLIFSAFLPDGAVVVNLGQYPVGYMDEYYAAGSPHIRAVYHDRCHQHRVDYHSFKSLVETAMNHFHSCFPIEDERPRDFHTCFIKDDDNDQSLYHAHMNRSPVGKAFVDFMDIMANESFPEPLPRNALYDMFARDHNATSMKWAEEMVFEKQGMMKFVEVDYNWKFKVAKKALAKVREMHDLVGCFPNNSSRWPLHRSIAGGDAYLYFPESTNESSGVSA